MKLQILKHHHIYCLVLRTTENCTTRWWKRYFSFVFDLKTDVETGTERSFERVRHGKTYSTKTHSPKCIFTDSSCLEGGGWDMVDMNTFTARDGAEVCWWLWNLPLNFKISNCSQLLVRVQGARYCAEKATFPDSSAIVRMKYHPKHRTTVWEWHWDKNIKILACSRLLGRVQLPRYFAE